MIRTGYSFHKAYGHIDDVIARIKEIGWAFAPIADLNSTFGFVKWNKAARKAGLRPVFGVELAVVPALGEKRPTTDHWTFIAKDDLAQLHQIILTATTNPGREPTITYAQAMAAVGLFKITGERCQLGEIEPTSDLYIGLSPATNKALFRQGVERGFEFAARSDNLYPRLADKETYRLALGRRATTQTYPQHILDDQEWHWALERIAPLGDREAAIANRDLILEGSTAILKQATLLVPEKTSGLRSMAERGAVGLGVDLDNPVYRERLDRELALIKEKNFEDYFFILADLIGWARERMVVGPARGSSCGSLVCYLLRITTIDPIPYGLLFERFIDINRSDLPDIDVDFDDEKRDMVFRYAEEKYGVNRVARLGTVGLFKPRSALKQVGAQLKVPNWMVERTLDGVIERSGGDSRAMLALHDTLESTEMGQRLLREYPEATVAASLEGHPNNASQHAAGIVLTEQPLINYVAVDGRTKSVMCDKKDAEELNLLKIDALGLTQLSIFARCLELIGEHPKGGFLEAIPLDDPAAFDVLNQSKFAGIFQFTGGALKSLTKQIKVKHINDMIQITALARPGPMATGGAGSWVQRKLGNERVTHLTPLMAELTQDTYGVVVFQETVMNIVRTIGKMSWEDTSAIRKAMSGRLGNEFFEQYWLKFRSGALANGLEEPLAKTLWDQINTFGSWAFNKSHAVAYGIVSYWCCWLKAHHPIEFAAATLDAEKDPMKQITLLRELVNEGIHYVPVDPDHSDVRWSIKSTGDHKKVLVGPLTQIKGIGPATVREILDSRAIGKPLRASLIKKLSGAQTEIDTLYPVREKIKALHPDLSAIGIVSQPVPIASVTTDNRSEIVLLGVINKIAPKDENENVNVMKRGGKVLTGPTQALNLFLRDDEDEIFCKVNRYKFERLGRPIIERGRPGKAIYAIKGQVWKGFRGVDVTNVKFLGFMDDEP